MTKDELWLKRNLIYTRTVNKENRLAICEWKLDEHCLNYRQEMSNNNREI